MAESKRAIVTLFLRGVAMVYFFAFSSLFVELPAIFLETGILPLKPTMKRMNVSLRSKSFETYPSLLWFIKYGTKRAAAEAWIPIGLDLALTLMCLVGMVGALALVLGFPSKSKKVSADVAHRGLFFMLWCCWVSFVTLGQPLMGQDWDKILVEVGFVCILLSPYENSMLSNETGLSLLRWVLFKVVFMTGSLKLLGGDNDWRFLSTLDHLWETSPLPTYLGYLLNTVDWKSKQVMQLVWHFSELVVPLMFLAPFRRLRISAGVLQVVIHLIMMFTANFQFYNLLMIFTTFCLYDDRFFASLVPLESYKSWFKLFEEKETEERPSRLANIATLIVEVLAWAQGFAFAVRFVTYGTLASQRMKGDQYTLNYTNAGMEEFTSQVLLAGVALFAFDFARTAFGAVRQHGKKACSSIPRLALTLAFIAAQFSMFLVSLPSATRHLDKQGNLEGYIDADLWSSLTDIEAKTYNYRLTNQYDFFVNIWNERAELIPQYSYEQKITHFPKYDDLDMKYKPSGDRKSMSPFVAPFSPRVDWKMSDASVEVSTKHGWVLHMMIKLLKGEPEVMALFNIPYIFEATQQPPKFMRFLARFVTLTSHDVEDWDYEEWPEEKWALRQTYGQDVDSKEYIEPIYLAPGAAYNQQFKPFGWDKEPKRNSVVFMQPFLLILEFLRFITLQVVVGVKGLTFMVLMFTVARHFDFTRAKAHDALVDKKVKTQ